MQNKIYSVSESIDHTLLKIFQRNKKVILIGLGANDPRNVFETTKSVAKHFPNRVFDMPLSENSMTGVIIGASMRGLLPIMVHQRVDFSLLSFEQIINQAAKWYYMFDGKKSIPIVIRMVIGRGWGQGPQHSQSLHSLFSHVPGLKIVMPSSPENASNLLYSAVLDPNPVIYIEHRWVHYIKAKLSNKLKKEKIGKCKIIKYGKDITIVTCSYMTVEVLRLSSYLNKEKIDFELIDLQTIAPLDKETILNSVKKTKRLLVLDIGHKSFGISAEIMATIFEKCYNILKSPPSRITNPDLPTPTSFALSKYYYPNQYDICNEIYKILGIKKKISKDLKPKDFYQDQPFSSFTGPF